MDLNYPVTNDKLYILRVKKNNPGVGQKLGRVLGADQLVCSAKPIRKIPQGSTVINYGRSEVPEWYRDDIRVLNSPEAVSRCVDKRVTLKLLADHGVEHLRFTTDKQVAKSWLKDGFKVIVRAIVNGKKGNGVSLCDQADKLPDAPLYTMFYNKTHEFRVHVCRGADGELHVIDFVQKKKMGKEKLAKLNLTDANDLVRNHKRGWVFSHNDLITPPGSEGHKIISKLGLDAAAALGMDFCAVDILAYIADGTVNAVVCEVNSAPGMSSETTFAAYKAAFENLVK